MRSLRAVLLASALMPLWPAHAQAALGIPGPSQLILDLVGKFTGGLVRTEGVTGWPNALHIDHFELDDANGAWLIADDVTLDWHPYRLAFKDAQIDALKIGRLQMVRLPQSPPPPPDQPQSSSSGLPVTVEIGQLQIATLDLGAPVMGTSASLSLAGSVDLPSLEAPIVHLAAHRLDGGGDYKVDAAVTEQRIDAALSVEEPEHGLIASLAKLPEIGPLKLSVATAGPRDALAAKATLGAGPLSADANGMVNLTGSLLDLQIKASAPAMTPAADVSWQAVALQAHVQGPFTKPDASGHLQIDQLTAAGAVVQRLAADLSGNQGKVTVHAAAEGVETPLPDPKLFAVTPIALDATVQLDDPARPVSFRLAHSLIEVQGMAKTAGPIEASVDLRVPQFSPFTKLAGVELEGSTQVHLNASTNNGQSHLEGDGTMSITGGLAPLPGLIGENATVGLTMAAQGQNLSISRMTVNGRTLTLALTGSQADGKIAGHIEAGLSDLSVAAPTLSGAVKTVADFSGTTSDLALSVHTAGEVGAPGVPQGPVTADVSLHGLPNAPAGTIKAEGRLGGAPLQLAIDAKRSSDGAVQVKIDKADWRSLHAEGALNLPPGAKLPLGRLQVRLGQLGDLRPFTGQPLAGTVDATIVSTPSELTIDAKARDAGIPGSHVGQASVTARVRDPLGALVVTASAQLSGIDAGGVTGSAKLDLSGPQSALAIRTDASLNVAGTPAQIAGAATLNLPAKTVQLSRLQVDANGEAARLLAPATLAFGGPIAVDRLRIGVRQAVLDVSGALSPRLDATITLRAPADIGAVAAPDLALDGVIALDAKLTGTPALPGGTVRLSATGLRARTGPGRSVPPAAITATATLNGKTAQVNARLVAGSAQVNVAGQAPLGAGAMDLRATGGLDLTMLDPILTAAGRRARGRLTLDARIAGTTSQPQLSGTAQLAGGEIQDFTQGLRIHDIAAMVRGDGGAVRIVSMTGKAGQGTLSASGTLGLAAPGMPIDLAIRADNARPITSDNLQIDLDANVTVRGQVQGTMDAGGRVLIRRAEIRIPSRLPAKVQALEVIRPGQKRPAAPTGPAPDVRLNLVVDAPQQIFVRGRGVDAELSGELRVQGGAAKPQVSGGFEMRRGQLSLAGTTLAFQRGKAGFDGTGPGGKIDPTLDFVAESTSNSITATLTIGGYASAPTIKLTSVPTLPQDEVLSYLLFRRSIKDVGPFQIAAIAASLAELTGVGGDGANPLSSIQSGLGLDRLSVGGSGTGSGASVEAGRYIANGVYLGAKQGTSSDTGTGATLQIDITRGLKLETDVGSGKGGNQVGLTYQFEY